MAIDFRIRDFLAPATILRLRSRFERLQWAPREVIERYQEERLAVVVEQAMRRVPYYRELFRRLDVEPSEIKPETLRDLLPELSKDEVRGQGASLVAEDARRRGAQRYRTSGTSGGPMSIWLDRRANALEFVYYWRHWSWAGFRLGDRFAEINTTIFARRAGFAAEETRWQPHLRRLLINSARISHQGVAPIATELRRRRCRFLKGTASALYALATCCSETGVETPELRAVFSTGEVLLPERRRRVETTFGCRVLDSYGHMERTVAVCQCPEGAYHVNEDYGLLELEPIQEATGSETGSARLARVLGTGLHNLSMPLLRYQTGDLIEVPETSQIEVPATSIPPPCPCGRTLRTIGPVRGREVDLVSTPDGRLLASLFVLPEIAGVEGTVQFVQTAPDRLEIGIATAVGRDLETVERLTALTRDLCGSGMRVVTRRVTAADLVGTAGGKFRPVIGLAGQAREPE